jgi:hypothetical protein
MVFDLLSRFPPVLVVVYWYCITTADWFTLFLDEPHQPGKRAPEIFNKKMVLAYETSYSEE